MVTKPDFESCFLCLCSVLAKILMVTKRGRFFGTNQGGSVLAKILMVTKLIIGARL